ncbi:MAG: hypothetical protein Q7S08_04960 [bacterium]|nr:hypothetical protein [bacterium]
MFIKSEHHTSSAKQILSALMLLAMLAVVFFGFAAMSYGSDGKMEGNCPFSVMGAPLCPQDLAAAAIHHISSYQSLLNAPVSPSLTVLIVALLLLVYGVFIFLIRPPTLQPQLVRYLYGSPHSSARDRKTTHWLSLFEHSPSLQ